MKEIQLSTGLIALVDDDDFEKVSAYKWYPHTQGYATTHLRTTERGNYKKILMHQLIMNAPKGRMIDHINLSKLDNRKENLRIVTMSQNKANCPPNKSNSTGYKGVRFYKSRNKYTAFIKVNYKSMFLGYFLTPEEAALAYNKAAIKHFGEFAYLNNVAEVERTSTTWADKGKS